jgi:tetratricopeptide (TPR) repeat protein
VAAGAVIIWRRMRRLRHLVLAGLAWLLAFTLASGDARADAAQARVHFERGRTYFEVDEYRKAIEEFKAAHIQRPDPAFLYNIAECYRRAGEPREALVFYRRFLSATPAADKTRTIVEKRVVEVQAAITDEPRPAPSLDPEPPNAPRALIGNDAEGPRPAEARPLYKRTWFLVTVGAVVAVSAVSIWALSRGRDLPDTALGNQSIF